MSGRLLEIALEDATRGALALRIPAWTGFDLSGLCPALTVDGVVLTPSACRAHSEASALRVAYDFEGRARLLLAFAPFGDSGVALRAELENSGTDALVLNRVTLLETKEAPGFGEEGRAVRVMEQGNYWGRVRPLPDAFEAPAATSGEAPVERPRRVSDLVWVAYDRRARTALLAGFLSSARWLGQVELIYGAEAEPVRWRVGFDGGDTRVRPGETAALEEAIFFAGADPWELLTRYGDAVRDKHAPAILDRPPVSWCSWYPHRLSVTEDRVLENARVAAERLKPLGMRIFEVDLGWERDHLPGAFEENERFPHGLHWLSEQLADLGFDLGVWKAPYTISEFDPVYAEHPEWLICDASGSPAPYWTWFWEPHGKVFILDLTHPGAQGWLREKIAGLHARGVRYFKADFIGCATHPLARSRHDQAVVCGGGLEASRIGAQIIREALPDALILCCGGAEMPGKGHWPIFYSCNDTGNTGFQPVSFQQANHQALACHLFKSRRWGILQPSCLCVGLPGTLEEARLRATAVFLAGGQVDVSDTLTTLPEDRWQVLTATLPPLGIPARPVDLFDPVYDGSAAAPSPLYMREGGGWTEHPAGSVWHVHVTADWDDWDLVGVFAFSKPEEKPQIARFVVPFEMLGLSEPRWAYAFWSGQFLGDVPGKRVNANGYVHPGDVQDLTVGDAPGALDVAFFGPAVKLFCLRKPRAHPWVLGTSFHQSGGAELRGVRWDAKTRTLSGELHRPAGETGFIAIAGGAYAHASGEVDGRPAPLRRGANGSRLLTVTATSSVTHWTVTFGDNGSLF